MLFHAGQLDEGLRLKCATVFIDSTIFGVLFLKGQAGRPGFHVTKGGKRQNYF